MMATNLHQRAGFPGNDSGMEDGQPLDDDYIADEEDNGELHKLEPKELVDPGLFKYNQKVCVAAIPSLLLVLAVTGKMLLVIASFGFALCLTIDPGGHNQRTMVIFLSLFIPCHILILYSTVPLLWVSLMSIVLMGLINSFVLLTGAWIVMQFSVFRKQEAEVCIMSEKLLFSAYPGVSACLLTWAVVLVIPLKFAPFVLTTIGFVFLQVFMMPTTSSFVHPTKKTDDNHIVDHLMLAAIAAVYCLLPTTIHILIAVYQHSLGGLFHLGFMAELIFLFAACVFLTTLMSLRSVFESVGWEYSLVIKIRWISGAIVTILCYHVLVNLGISSHFLPWLPAAIAVYSSYGALLSYKKYRVASLVCLALAVLFSMIWPLKLPWKLSFTFMFGLPLTSIYVLLLGNSMLCLSCVYVATHGRQEFFSLLILVQTVGFIKCELILHDAELYGWPLLTVTSIAAVYTLQRLLLSRRLPQGISCFCMSAHLTKVLAVLLLPSYKSDMTSLVSCFTLFFFVFMVIKTFMNEIKLETSVKETAVTVGLLCLSVVVNINPLLFIFWSYLFQEQATMADAAGICCIMCGILIITMCSLHLSSDHSEVKVRKLGIMGIGVGLLIIVLQPGTELSWYTVFQWGEVLSVILTCVIVSSDIIRTFPQIAVSSVLIGLCPGIRGVFMLYPELEVPVVNAAMFVITSLFVTCAVLCFFKAQLLGQTFEPHIIRLCVILVVTSQITLITDLVTKQRHERILSVAGWKLFLVANLIISVCLKVLSAQQYTEIIPLTDREDEKKKLSLLPVAGNIATAMTFLLTCLLSPASGFLHDVWCCGASLILVCLQKDKIVIHNLTDKNQSVPTKITAICVLVLMSVYRTYIWDANSWTFVRCVIEILLIAGSLPVYCALWEATWKGQTSMEKLVVFLWPLNVPIILYGSSYTSWALAGTGVVSAGWMASTVLPLVPYQTRT